MGGVGYGDGIASESSPDTLIQNNWFKGSELGSVYSDSKIINNTFSRDGTYYPWIIALTGASIVNNIFYDAWGINCYGTPAIVQNNNFYNMYFDVLLSEGTSTYYDIASMEASLPYCTGNVSCPPNLVSANDFHLQASSCCIDAGTTTFAPAYDFDNDPRPLGTGYDIGADEFTLPVPIPVPSGNVFISLIVLGIMFTGMMLPFDQ
jgi:hypothetical protein